MMTVTTRELNAREAWNQALERRYFRVEAGSVRCRVCGEPFGLACAPALTAQHLDVCHQITTLDN